MKIKCYISSRTVGISLPSFLQGGEMAKLIDILRARAMAWVQKATLAQLGDLPVEVLEVGLSVAGAVASQSRKGVNGNGKHRRPRVRTKMQKRMSRADADKIREAMGDLSPDTSKYRERRDALCRRMGYTIRQFGNAISGLKRAQTRLANQKAEKK